MLDTRAGGKLRYLELARRTLRAARPDVVYAHFLVPSGLIAALGTRAPLVVTAHGRDVRNIGELPGIAAATRLVVRRAATVVCVSDYLRRELETKLPAARGKTEVVSSGVDLERFAVAPAPDGPPRFLCVGALEERKNVVRLADAFARLGEGTLTFAGDGPLRAQLEGRDGVRARSAACRTTRCRALLAESHVLCQPSLIEPLGQALLEGDGRRPLGRRDAHRRPARVRPARRGRPRRPARRRRARRRAASRRRRCRARTTAAREAAAAHDVRRQAERIEAILSRAAAAGRRA